MGLFNFSHSHKRSIDSYNGDLTLLDPPMSPQDIPTLRKPTNSIDLSNKSFNIMNEQNFTLYSDTQKSTNNNNKNNNYIMTSNGLQGEMERNLILEQQLKILSQQAMMVIDQLNEKTRENQLLKEENEQLRRISNEHNNNRFSLTNIKNSLSRRQNSLSSSESSVFSKMSHHNHHHNKNKSISNGFKSQNDRNQSIGSNETTLTSIDDTEDLHHINYMNEYAKGLQDSFTKELNELNLQNSQYKQDISNLEEELKTVNEKLIKSDKHLTKSMNDVEHFKDIITSQILEQNDLKNTNMETINHLKQLNKFQSTELEHLKTKLSRSSDSSNDKFVAKLQDKHQVEIEYYQTQLVEVSAQLEMKRKTESQTRKRLQDYEWNDLYLNQTSRRFQQI